MAIAGDGYELTHVSIRGGQPLNDMLHFALHEQLSVLYGLNGAGKSRILRALADALSGRRRYSGRADLHVKIDVERTPESGFTREFSARLSEALKEVRGEMYTSSEWADYDILYEEPRAPDDEWPIAEKLYALMNLIAAQRRLSDADGEVLHEIAREGRFVLQAGEDGRRVLWLAAHLADHPDLADSLNQRMQNSLDDLRAGRQGAGLPSHPLVDNISALNYLLLASSAKDTGAATTVSDIAELCLPLVRLGSSYELQPLSLIDGLSEDDDIDHLTLRSVTGAGGRSRARVYRGVADDIVVSPEVRSAITSLEARCNDYLAEVLMYPPTLRFHVPEPDRLLYGASPRWEFATTDAWASISELSSAQLRWAKLAIALAVANRSDRPTMFLCDEPERGLHRLAEQRVSDGLANLITRAETGIIAATHSPLIVGNTKAHRVLTYRNTADATALRPWSLAISDAIDTELAGIDLGLAFGDLLQLMNVAVVVEGLHDEYVFKTLLRQQINNASAGIFAMRGAAHAKSLAEAKMLFHATNGPILVVLDGISHQQLAPIWQDIKNANTAGHTDDALREIGRLSSLKVEEAAFLAELAKAAVESKTLQRIEVHGLSQPDIICYLPESSVLSASEDVSWSALIEQWTAAAGDKSPRNIKGFLKNERLLPHDAAELNDRVRDAAVHAVGTPSIVHPDLINLGDTITGLASRRSAR